MADPNSKRQTRRQGDWTLLPRSYGGPTPDWPLSRDFAVTIGKGEFTETIPVHDEELQHWERLWCKGQAVVWRQNCQEDRVARLCRALAITDVQLDVSRAGFLSEIRQLEEDLGLSQSGMLRNKWQYAPLDEDNLEDEEPQEAPATRRASGGVTSLMDRLQKAE